METGDNSDYFKYKNCNKRFLPQTEAGRKVELTQLVRLRVQEVSQEAESCAGWEPKEGGNLA